LLKRGVQYCQGWHFAKALPPQEFISWLQQTPAPLTIRGQTPYMCCMRMKGDHILLAELTGDEAWDFMELLNTGHPGTITTAHANG
ncbi:ATPase, T2SS/T4P/T4SS family, partial [Salmonella enterica subsp. enterica serovar Montevideo]|nr:ATPase, T2SS/T4P/T4SS family [Salmonella enterica subsp. enterica serovar Montevideo]